MFFQIALFNLEDFSLVSHDFFLISFNDVVFYDRSMCLPEGIEVCSLTGHRMLKELKTMEPINIKHLTLNNLPKVSSFILSCFIKFCFWSIKIFGQVMSNILDTDIYTWRITDVTLPISFPVGLTLAFIYFINMVTFLHFQATDGINCNGYCWIIFIFCMMHICINYICISDT